MAYSKTKAAYNDGFYDGFNVALSLVYRLHNEIHMDMKEIFAYSDRQFKHRGQIGDHIDIGWEARNNNKIIPEFTLWLQYAHD